MFFLLFGGGLRFKDLGAGEERACPRCHNTTTWQRLRQFNELTFFFIPVARWGRRELETCGVCGESEELPRTARRRWPAHHADATPTGAMS